MTMLPRFLAKTVRPVLVAGVAAAVAATTAVSASAATTITATDLTARATNGTSISASVTMTASSTLTVDTAKICARDAKDRNVDFPAPGVKTISTGGTTITGSQTMQPGTYSYWACAKVGGYWQNLGARKSITVVPDPVLTAVSAALPVGDLPGWKQTFVEDFSTPVARGSFPGPYAGKWMSYSGFTDTSKVGDYDQKIIAAQDGVLDLALGTVDGRPKGAAPIPLVNGQWGGQTYGRFSVRMKADPLAGYGTGFLLWPDSSNWNDGEIDFPESGLNDVVKGYNHCVGNPSVNCLVVESSARYSDWHTYTIDWTPSKLSFLVDGAVVESTTSNIPSKPMHWVMQAATNGNAVAAKANSGHLQIDWAAIYAYQP